MSEADWIIELFLERVAVMVIDGEQSEDVAVRHAYRIVREKYGRENLPKKVVDALGSVVKGTIRGR